MHWPLQLQEKNILLAALAQSGPLAVVAVVVAVVVVDHPLVLVLVLVLLAEQAPAHLLVVLPSPRQVSVLLSFPSSWPIIQLLLQVSMYVWAMCLLQPLPSLLLACGSRICNARSL